MQEMQGGRDGRERCRKREIKREGENKTQGWRDAERKTLRRREGGRDAEKQRKSKGEVEGE